MKIAIVRFGAVRWAFPFVVVPPLTTLLPSLIAQITIMSGERERERTVELISRTLNARPPAPLARSGTNDHLSSLHSLFGGRFSRGSPPSLLLMQNNLQMNWFFRGRGRKTKERGKSWEREERDGGLCGGNFLRALLATTRLTLVMRAGVIVG